MELSREPLSDEQIKEALSEELSAWQPAEGEKAIERRLVFSDFVTAFSFMTAVAMRAEKMNHHPELSNVYNRVELRLSTHDAGGVTEYDLVLARAVEEAASRAGAESASS